MRTKRMNDLKTQVKSLMLIHGQKRSKWEPRPIIFFPRRPKSHWDDRDYSRFFPTARDVIYHWREQRAFSAPVSISAEVRGETRDSVENASRENISGSLSSFSSLCFPPEYIYTRRITERILRRARVDTVRVPAMSIFRCLRASHVASCTLFRRRKLRGIPAALKCAERKGVRAGMHVSLGYLKVGSCDVQRRCIPTAYGDEMPGPYCGLPPQKGIREIGIHG